VPGFIIVAKSSLTSPIQTLLSRSMIHSQKMDSQLWIDQYINSAEDLLNNKIAIKATVPVLFCAPVP